MTLDDIMMLSLAKNDPVMFVSRLKTPIVIDEIQKAPELLSAIKMAIESDRRAGQFILTGIARTYLPISEEIFETLKISATPISLLG